MALRACSPNQCSNYDSDEEFNQARLPLINNHPQQPAYVIVDPPFANKNEAWNVSNPFPTFYFLFYHRNPFTRSHITFYPLYLKNMQINPYTLDQRAN